MAKRSPSLVELIEEEKLKNFPNPFIVACAELFHKMQPLVDSVPPHRLLDAHASCAAALMILCAEPTHSNLEAARNALEAYEAAEFCN